MRMQQDVVFRALDRSLPDDGVFGGGMGVGRVVYAAIVGTS